MTNLIQLGQQPVHISTMAAKSFKALDNFTFSEQDFEGYIDALCSDEDPGCLVMIENSEASWPTWEMHPEGDELVVILEGRGTFFQQTESGIEEMAFSPGDAVLNPKGVWHTVDVEEPLKALYITTCPGTDHKPR